VPVIAGGVRGGPPCGGGGGVVGESEVTVMGAFRDGGRSRVIGRRVAAGLGIA
jgi:hypothetical protein